MDFTFRTLRRLSESIGSVDSDGSAIELETWNRSHRNRKFESPEDFDFVNLDVESAETDPMLHRDSTDSSTTQKSSSSKRPKFAEFINPDLNFSSIMRFVRERGNQNLEDGHSDDDEEVRDIRRRDSNGEDWKSTILDFPLKGASKLKQGFEAMIDFVIDTDTSWMLKQTENEQLPRYSLRRESVADPIIGGGGFTCSDRLFG